MLDYLLQIVRDNSAIAVFFTIGMGFVIGNLRYKSFTLGPVTSTLLVGVAVGQLDIPMSETLKSVAFLLFLFSIGYSVGPQFFRSLKGEGLKQIGFAVVEALLCLATVVVAAKVTGMDKGMAVGLFAGSQTVSAVMGVGSDVIKNLGLSPEETRRMLHIIPACYASSYVFGTIGTAWVIANLGPVLFGGLKKARRQTAELEASMDNGDFEPEPGMVTANRTISFRAYIADSYFFNKPRTVQDIEEFLRTKGSRHFIERLRVKGEICDPSPELKVRRGDVLVISGERESILENQRWIGPETTDHDLLNFSTENLRVTISKKGADGMTLRQLRNQPYMKGVMVRKILRENLAMPLHGSTALQQGDVVTLVGLPQDVAEAVPEIGYSDRDDGHTDMAFVCLGTALGCLVGAMGFMLDGIPVSLSTSGGAILAGLIMGWLRSKRPSVGHVPRPVLWFLDNMGLNLFIACVGIGAGPTFITGFKEVGVSMFLIGVVCTTIPLILSMYIGVKLFKFPIAVAFGCVAGSRNAVAALGAIQDSVDSTIPMLGYTVTYAVSSIGLIFCGMVVPLLV